MSFDYSPLQNVALSQISDKGRDVTYTQVTAGTFDPTTNTVTGASETDTTIKAVITDFDESQIDGTIIQRKDKQVLITADVVTPKLEDKITDGSVTYQIVNINQIAPGDIVMLYKLQVRR